MYHIMEKYDSDEGLEIRNFNDLFNDTVDETEMLGKTPFQYEKLEEAKLVVKALTLIFKGKLSVQSFIILKEIKE